MKITAKGPSAALTPFELELNCSPTLCESAPLLVVALVTASLPVLKTTPRMKVSGRTGCATASAVMPSALAGGRRTRTVMRPWRNGRAA